MKTMATECRVCGRGFRSETRVARSGSEYENGRDTEYEEPVEEQCPFCRGEAKCGFGRPVRRGGTYKVVLCGRRASLRVEDGNYCLTHGVAILAEVYADGAVGFPVQWDSDGRMRTDLAPGETA